MVRVLAAAAAAASVQSCVSVWPMQPSHVGLCRALTAYSAPTATTSTVCHSAIRASQLVPKSAR